MGTMSLSPEEKAARRQRYAQEVLMRKGYTPDQVAQLLEAGWQLGQFITFKPSRTKQAPAAGTDARAIVAKYRSTGDWQKAIADRGQAVYGDFGSGFDFTAAQMQVVRARELFDALPAEVRSFCANDPARFLDLVHDPAMIAKCKEWGLVVPAEPELPAVGDAPVPPEAPADVPPTA